MKHSLVRIFAITTYIMLFLFNCFMLYFLRNYFNLLFLAALIVIPILSFLSVYFLRRAVTVFIDGASLVENRRDEFLFHIHVKNSSPLFANNCVLHVTISNPLFKESTTHTINLPVTPLSTVLASYPVASGHCGIVTISVTEICIYDMFSLFSLKKPLSIIREIPVFPNYNIVTEDFSMDYSKGYSNLEESKSKGNDTSEVSDIREYIPGDKLQNIHWKLSAKKDLLMVKEHVHLTSNQLIFYIELALSTENVLDKVLDFAYGIGIYLCNNNIPFTYMWYSFARNECCKATILSANELRDTIFEILYESPIENYTEIRSRIKALSGHENYITIGADYVLEKETTEK